MCQEVQIQVRGFFLWVVPASFEICVHAQALEYTDIPPTMGSVIRAYKHFFVVAGPREAVSPEAILNTTTHCRVTHGLEMPKAGDFMPLDGACFRLAWMYGYGLHLSKENSMDKSAWQSLLDRWRQSAGMFVVNLELLPEAQKAMTKKLQLDQDLKANESLQGLVGFKLLRMTAKIQKDLKEDGKTWTVDAVYAELCKVSWAEEMKHSTVAVQLKVHKRITPHAARLLSLLESHFGKHHPLAALQGLDQVCQKTASKDDAASARSGYPNLLLRHLWFFLPIWGTSLKVPPLGHRRLPDQAASRCSLGQGAC